MDDFIKGDFHTHTKYSIEPKTLSIFEARARYGPLDLIKTAIARGLNVLAITDHDTLQGAEIGEKLVKKEGLSDKILLIKGEEISSREGHILGIGINKVIKPGMSAIETIDAIKKQGGVSIIPHPFSPYGIRNIIFNLKKFDGMETVNPFASFSRGNKKAQHMINLFDVASIGSTDAHTLGVIGRVFTKLWCDTDVDSVLNAIRKKQTEAVGNYSFVYPLYNLFRNLGLCFIPWYKRPKV
jgi:hypothetical protein